MKAIILAGGEGARLRPITSDLPKPLVPVMGMPLLARIIMLLKEHGITQIGIATCYMAEKIEQTIKDGADWGVSITYFHEEVPLGTAGAVKQAQDFLSDTFLVIAGDCLTDCNLKEAIAYHQEKQSMATLVLKRVDIPLRYGVVVTDKGGRIVRFLEKPSWNEVFSDTVNTGIYILNKEALSRVENGKTTDFSKDLFPGLLAEGCPMYGYEMQGYWCDVGDVDVYRRSHFDLFDHKLAMSEAFGMVTIEEGAIIEEGARIVPPVRIGRDSRIEAGAKVGKYAVIGRGCLVRGGASVSRSVVMDGVLLEKGASVRGSVLCKHVVVCRDATIFEQTVIGEHSRVGRGAVVCPGIRVFPYKEVPEGIRLVEHLIWGANKNPTCVKNGRVKGAWGYEVSTALAENLGASMGAEGRCLAVAGGEDPASISLMQAFSAGAAASGATVYDLGCGTVPLVSAAVRIKHLFGGVWFGVQKEAAEIIFIGENGALLSDKKAKVMDARQRGETVPALSDKVGRPMDCAAFRREYIDNLLHAFQTTNTKIPIVLHGGNETIVSYAKATLSRMGCIVAGGTENEAKGAVCAYLSAEGRELLLYDEHGTAVFGEGLRALFYLLLSKCKDRKKVRPEKTIPEAVLRMIQRSGMQTEIIDADTKEEALCAATDADARRERMVFYDAVGALCMLVQIMAQEKKSLASLLTELPRFYVISEELPCAEEKKAAMLTYLKTFFDEKEAVGGVYVVRPHGKAYLFPDAQREIFHLAVESMREEYAREIFEMCKTVFDKAEA